METGHSPQNDNRYPFHFLGGQTVRAYGKIAKNNSTSRDSNPSSLSYEPSVIITEHPQAT